MRHIRKRLLRRLQGYKHAACHNTYLYVWGRERQCEENILVYNTKRQDKIKFHEPPPLPPVSFYQKSDRTSNSLTSSPAHVHIFFVLRPIKKRSIHPFPFAVFIKYLFRAPVTTYLSSKCRNFLFT